MLSITQFNTIADTLMERLRTFADGKTPVRLFNEINRATLDAIALVMTFYQTMYTTVFAHMCFAIFRTPLLLANDEKFRF